MVFKILLKRLDKLLCNYLGINKDEIRPNSVKIQKNKLIITNTIPFKRHSFQEPWDKFNNSHFKQLHKDEREKLGLAAGKALAKGLTISFEEPPIDKS